MNSFLSALRRAGKTVRMLRPGVLSCLRMMPAAAGILLLLPLPARGEARLHGGLHTAEKLANARRNVERFDWARTQRNEAVGKAAPWLAMSDEELWRLIPGQKLPRCIDVTWDYNHDQEAHLGCLKCGDEIKRHGNYPYLPDFRNKPWKLTCPSCGVVFPTNDFGRYYESGLDEKGFFDPAKADRALLFNAEHPDPADPLHKYGVDDGFGAVDANGRRHKFIGYYGWKLWRFISEGVGDLSQAYVLTGDKTYARKAAILLDRIADAYPDMDWAPYRALGWYHSDGSSRKGKIEGSIWETYTLYHLAACYDRILSGTADNPELEAFLRSRSERFRLPAKGTREQFVKNVDDNLLRVGVQAVKDGRIKGNFGMHQRSIISCAVALDQMPETEQWIDWAFAADGGGIPQGIVSGIDRDGMGNEGGPGYALSVWLGSLIPISDILADYPRYSKHHLYRDYPSFSRMLTAGWRLAVLDWTTPNIGDSGSTGEIAKLQCTPDVLARPFKYLGDRESAVAAWRANGNSGAGILRDIFSEEPETLGREIDRVARESADTQTTGGRHLAGYGLASLELGRGPEGKALWMYYGRSDGHGHRDRLNLGLYAFGVDLTPDLGYPEFAGTQPERKVWTANTIAHNTLTVDETGQQTNWTGFPRFFKRLAGLGAMEVESPNVYPQTKDYARTALFVEAEEGNAYAVDLFRARGGKDHLLSFHGPAGPVTAEGLGLETQTSGTYAGAGVPYLDPREGRRAGYSYLNRVERSTGATGPFRLDWKAEAGYRGVTESDDIHLRYHALTPCTDVALADAEPPRNKKGNPKRLRYALMRRAGEELESVFAGVLEPYRSRPFLRSVTRLKTGAETSGAVALRVEHNNGTVDFVLSNPAGGTLELADGVRMTGSAGFVRTDAQRRPARLALIAGTDLSFGEARVRCEAPAYTGTVVRMDRDTQGDGELWVDAPLPEGRALAGEFLSVAGDGIRSACYEIRSVAREGNLSRINCGPVTFVRGLVDPKDESKGYTFDFQEGSRFTIPRHAEWARGGTGE